MTNDEIKKMLGEIYPWPWSVSQKYLDPERNYAIMDKDCDIICETDLGAYNPSKINADFISKTPEIISELLKQNELLLTVVGHYAHLEANDNGDSEEPACKALWDMGYTKEHPYLQPHNPPTLMDELKTLKKQNEVMREALKGFISYHETGLLPDRTIYLNAKAALEAEEK